MIKQQLITISFPHCRVPSTLLYTFLEVCIVRHNRIRVRSPNRLLTLLLIYSTWSLQEFRPIQHSNSSSYNWIQKYGNSARFCRLPKSSYLVLLWFKISLLLSIHCTSRFKSSWATLFTSKVQGLVEYNTLSSTYILLKQFFKHWGR